MKVRKQSGFSLIELILVVAIIGIIASLAIPALQKGIRAAKNGSSFATMRTIGSTQVGCFSQKNRFCRLTELQSILSNGLGTTAGEKVIRNTFTFEMNPDPVSDAELASAYVVTATSNVVGETVYKYELTEKGEIKQLLP